MTTIDIDSPYTPVHQEFYYQTLLSFVDEVVIFTDTNFIIQTWNVAAEKIYKIPASQAIGKRSLDIIKPEYLNTTREVAVRKLLKDNYWKGIIKLTHYNEVIFLQSTLTAVTNAEGVKVGYLGVSKNITGEMQLKKSLQNLISLLSLSEESFLIIERDHKIAFLQIKGSVQNVFNADYETGDNILRYISPGYINEIKQSCERAFKGETLNNNLTIEAETTLYFNIIYSPLKNNHGNITNVSVIIKDITRQKELEDLRKKKALMERSLLESRKFFDEFMQNSPLAAWIVDAEGYIQYMNASYLKSFAFTDEVIGKNIYELYSKELADDYFENNKKVIETGSIIETIEKGKEPGKNSNYKVIKFPVYYKERDMIAVWAVDISAQMETLESLSLLNQHKSKLVSIIAHDLRGPLGMNLSFLKSIVEDYDGYIKEQLLDPLNMIIKSASNCFELVEDLLRWAKTQMGGTMYNPASVNIQTEILKVMNSVWDQIRQKKIQLVTGFNYHNEIFVDHDMFAIVLRNFLTNAIKFSYQGGIINIETQLINDHARISVKDCGTGMSRELIQKLLKKSNHESESGTSGEKGSGLGLFMAKDYIEQNGGTMHIERGL